LFKFHVINSSNTLQLGINNDLHGTRLALFYFASKTKKVFNHHSVGKDEAFKDYRSAQKAIDDTSLVDIRNSTGLYPNLSYPIVSHIS